MNTKLTNAKIKKDDEFYTRLEDIENELLRDEYVKYFENKIIYCNCDDPKTSKFFEFFKNHSELRFKKVIFTYYESNYKFELYEDNLIETPLNCDGDFRNCIEIIKECNIIVTNPPFSLFREMINLIVSLNKDYILIGNKNAITYNDVFKLIKNNKLSLGYTQPKNFNTLNGVTQKVDGICRWFTNLKLSKNYKELKLNKEYNEIDYPKYDNYNAINVDKVKDIPKNYNECIGVPITFLDYYNPEEFEIIGLGLGKDNFTPTKFYKSFNLSKTGKPCNDKRDYVLYVRNNNGKYITSDEYKVDKVYARIIIKRINC